MAKRITVKCPRCKGKGYRYLIVGPHITEFGLSSGGSSKYDCKLCKATGKVSRRKSAQYLKSQE